MLFKNLACAEWMRMDAQLKKSRDQLYSLGLMNINYLGRQKFIAKGSMEIHQMKNPTLRIDSLQSQESILSVGFFI